MQVAAVGAVAVAVRPTAVVTPGEAPVLARPASALEVVGQMVERAHAHPHRHGSRLHARRRHPTVVRSQRLRCQDGVGDHVIVAGVARHRWQ